MNDLNEQRKHLSENYPTLRDQFAMAALSGLFAWAAGRSFDDKEMVEKAYWFADAMMKARAPQVGTEGDV